ELHAPAADPLIIGVLARRAAERELDAGAHAARITDPIAAAFLELPERNLILLEAPATAADDAVVEHLAGAAIRAGVQYPRRNAAGETVDRIQHCCGVGTAIAPAVVMFIAQAHIQARARRRIEIDLALHGRVRHGDVGIGE